jgi:hypothetical protein
MNEKINISTRWNNMEPTKNFVFWACVASVAVTIFVGFKWGGWVTGGSAQAMAETAANEARIELAVASCVLRFGEAENVNGRLAKLKKVGSWERGSYLEKAGWATPTGTDEPVSEAGGRCAELLLAPKTTNLGAPANKS